ncbi:MAG: hypothetical protein ACM3JH_13525 [Acidithiobacillales bacterium]
MVDPDDGAPLESRPPRLEDLLKICGALNANGSKYVVIGGMAVIQAGFVRATEDIDLLRLKQTVREKDALDRRFLEELIAQRRSQ